MKRLFCFVSVIFLLLIPLISLAFGAQYDVGEKVKLLFSIRGTEYFMIPLLMTIYYAFVWKITGKDDQIDDIVPPFFPPKNIGNCGEIDPGSARYSINRDIDVYCFVANIIDLAIKGYIYIKESSISITNKPITGELPAAEATFLEKLASFGGVIFLVKDTFIWEPNFDLIKARSASESKMKESGKLFFTTYRGYWLTGIAFVLLFPVLDHIIYSSISYGMIIVFLITIVSRLMFKVWYTLKNTLDFLILFVPLMILCLIVLLPFFIGQDHIDWTVLFIIVSVSGLCSLIILLSRKLLPKYSKEGRKLIAEVEGLKLYINTTRKLQIVNSLPIKTPEIFERLLPWAFAFGLEKTLADKFKDSLEEVNYSPKWCSRDKQAFIYGNGIKRLTYIIEKYSVMPHPIPRFVNDN